jgi:phosphatidylserine/phosphatidylglycerophosphate/cardiolipin synthase-like enzyme
MMEALVAAAKRGVQIFLIGNSPESAEALPGNGKFLYRKASGLYDELLSRGGGYIRLFEWRRDMNIDGRIVRGGAFHSKVFSVDGLITSVGPYNVSKASFGKHTEGTMVIIDPEFARQTEQMFQHDLEFSSEVTPPKSPSIRSANN